uniref:Uncharacterized protein n=2 Tax=Fusarium oxysporum TaxID=5507 RepID=A0A0D2YCC8_FUSOF
MTYIDLTKYFNMDGTLREFRFDQICKKLLDQITTLKDEDEKLKQCNHRLRQMQKYSAEETTPANTALTHLHGVTGALTTRLMEQPDSKLAELPTFIPSSTETREQRLGNFTDIGNSGSRKGTETWVSLENAITEN